MVTSPNQRRPSRIDTIGCLALVLAVVTLTPGSASCHRLGSDLRVSSSMFSARRAADDSRPLARSYAATSTRRSDSDDAAVVVGKFKAPAPDRIQVQRIPKSGNFASQTLGASYRVSDEDSGSYGDKIVHGVIGASASAQPRTTTGLQSIQRTVGAKMQVSDEGLNYPPSKLSADIYGNVAEIVTAPPEAVESDFLIPQSGRFSARQNRRF